MIVLSLIADGIFVYIASDEITLIIVFLIWRIIRVVNSEILNVSYSPSTIFLKEISKIVSF